MRPHPIRYLLVPTLLLLACCSVLSAESRKKLALVGGMLLDRYEVPPLHHAAVVIEGNRIVQVGPAAEVAIPPDAEVIDTSGRVMMPGLIDLHVHLIILGHGDYDRWDPWIAKNNLVEKVKVRDAVLKTGMERGVAASYDNLDELLASRVST